MSTHWNKIVVGALLTFILGCGVAIGVAVDRLWLRPSAAADAKAGKRRARGNAAEREDRLVKLFRKRLDLTAKQEQTVRSALREMLTGVAAVRKRSRRERKAVREKARAQINAVLTADQQQRYAKMIKRYEQRRRKRRGHRRRR